MTGTYDKDGMQTTSYDDDRLLAWALGFEEDPELLAAASDDPELAARLEAVRADVAAVGERVAAAVPAPDEHYADLSGGGWSGLRELLEPPVVTPWRPRLRWRVVAPVAALLVLALVVGIAVVDGGGVAGFGDAASEVSSSSDDGEAATALDDPESADDAAASTTGAGETFSEQAGRFAVVVLGRAREAAGGVQRFAVLRVYKGEAPRVVELVVGEQPADAGRLHVLLLEPTAPPVPQPEAPRSTTSPGAETATPWPAGSAAPAGGREEQPLALAKDGPGVPLAASYTYRGKPAVVRELAPGTDPSAVVIPAP